MFLFMAIQHRGNANSANQLEAGGDIIDFNMATVLVIALEVSLGATLDLDNNLSINTFEVYPNPVTA